jgi:Pentapeptide repeats (8 copies)
VRKIICVAICGTLIALVLILPVVWLAPRWLMTWPYTGASITAPGTLPVMEVLKAQNDLRHSLVETLQLIATVVTAIGLVFTLYFTNENVRIAQENSVQSVKASELTLEAQREGRLGDRFSEAVEKLSHDDIAVRVGAIYALSLIARESKKDYWPVAHLLCTFLRSRRPVGQVRAPGVVAPPDDAKAVAAFFRMGLDVPEGAVDLSRTNLHGLDMSGGMFKKANFDTAELDGAVLARAILTGATLANVNARTANFTCARLDECFMNGMDLTNARLTRADLRDASVTGAKVYQVFGPILNVTQKQKDSAEVWEELPT